MKAQLRRRAESLGWAQSDALEMHLVVDGRRPDPLLCIGFHALEGSRRWTTERARLPAALWEGFEQDFPLRVELAGSPIPRWVRQWDSLKIGALEDVYGGLAEGVNGRPSKQLSISD